MSNIPQWVTVKLEALSMHIIHSNLASLMLVSSFGVRRASGKLLSLVKSNNLCSPSSKSSTAKISSESGTSTTVISRPGLRPLELVGRPEADGLRLPDGPAGSSKEDAARVRFLEAAAGISDSNESTVISLLSWSSTTTSVKFPSGPDGVVLRWGVGKAGGKGVETGGGS